MMTMSPEASARLILIIIEFYAKRNRRSSEIISAFKVEYKLLNIPIIVFFSFGAQT